MLQRKKKKMKKKKEDDECMFKQKILTSLLLGRKKSFSRIFYSMQIKGEAKS